MSADVDVSREFTELDWSAWVPRERATLLFVMRDEKILLIHKKRGLGAGKINGPGGRIEAGESARDAAVREIGEELCVTPVGVEHRGSLHFQFVDGHSIHCEVYAATDCTGEPTETPEAVPRWTRVDAIPYDRMWADDRHWMPHLVAGRRFKGWFLFENDTMLGHRVTAEP